MAKFTDDEVAEKLIGFEKFKDRAEMILDTVETQSKQIRALEDAQLQEQSRIEASAKKAVSMMQRSGSYRLRQWAIILGAIVIIIGTIWQAASTGNIDYEKLAEMVKGIPQ